MCRCGISARCDVNCKKTGDHLRANGDTRETHVKLLLTFHLVFFSYLFLMFNILLFSHRFCHFFPFFPLISLFLRRHREFLHKEIGSNKVRCATHYFLKLFFQSIRKLARRFGTGFTDTQTDFFDYLFVRRDKLISFLS